jgi:hypothetical protein
MPQKTNKQQVNLPAFVVSFTACLDERQRGVLHARYGLGNQEPQTLQAIGDRLGITRERVRQIEAAALAALRTKLNAPYAKRVVQAAVNRLNAVGGVEHEETFFANIKKAIGDSSPRQRFVNPARFMLELSEKAAVHRYHHDFEWHPHWYLTEADKKRAHAFIAKLVSALNNRRTEVLERGAFKTVFAETAKAASLTDLIAQNYLAISKRFTTNPFSDFGLASWSEINPKTARDWAYLVLKREKRPLHFVDIARAIATYRKNKRVNVQTVHNELIKDKRFVLVGRGLYGLRERGLIPGTALEIIRYVLQQHGPLNARAVVSHVKKQRFIKDGTILINLQNKKHFQCRSDGKYIVRES